jgi:hypothetical protein
VPLQERREFTWQALHCIRVKVDNFISFFHEHFDFEPMQCLTPRVWNALFPGLEACMKIVPWGHSSNDRIRWSLTLDLLTTESWHISYFRTQVKTLICQSQ